DPRNAATIADHVGDNVGDCAGMAADLFESYALTLVAALILGRAAFGEAEMVFPLVVPAIGVLTALIGLYLTTGRAGQSDMATRRRSFLSTAVITAVRCTVGALVHLPGGFAELRIKRATTATDVRRRVAAGAMVIRIALGVLILYLVGHCARTEDRPVR